MNTVIDNIDLHKAERSYADT